MYENKVIRRNYFSENQVDELLKKYSEDNWRYVGLDPCGGMVFERAVTSIESVDTGELG